MSDTREQIIITAYNRTGSALEDETPEQYNTRLIANATEIQLALREGSPISKHIENIADSTPFRAVITGGGVESNTGRGKIALSTRDKDGTAKEEDIRTDFLNTADGKRVFDLARSLKGHTVLVYKQMEVGGDNKKHRVARHIVDLGVES